MQQAHKQNGSVHVIVTVVLAVALFGSLGFTFYQNFIAKKAVESDVKQADTVSAQDSDNGAKDQEAVQSPLTETVSLSLGDRHMTMKYPKNWTVATKGTTSLGEDGAESKTITSPDGRYVIWANIYSGGLGGMCGGDLTFATTRLTDLPNGTGTFLLEYTMNPLEHSPEGVYATAGVVIEPKSTDKSKLVPGEYACNMGPGYFTSSGHNLSDEPTMLPAVVRLTMSVTDSGQSTSLSEQKAWQSTVDYEIARQILLTLKG